MEEIKKLLGRDNLSPVELAMFNLFKVNKNYRFEKDKNGNLITVLNE